LEEATVLTTLNTVLGPVQSEDLGFTLIHEHVGTNAAGLRHTYPEFIDRSGIIEQSAAALKEAYDEGLRTMVDVSTFDLGRDIEAMQEVSKRSGVRIVAATGNHLSVPRPFGDVSPDIIAPLYIREIEQGIEGTGVKAGIIKVASDRGGITPLQEVVLRAAARAHLHTGIPISTHTWSPERVGEQQVRILEEEGVELSRVYIGHSNDDTDLDYLLGLLGKGVWLGLDRYPGGRVPGTPQWEQRTEIAKKLIDAGYCRRIMLSHDYSVPKARHGAEAQEERRRANPDGYNFIPRKVLPKLKELGASDADIRQIMEENPRQFFEGS
jgi:phosphotriesterase-related protein